MASGYKVGHKKRRIARVYSPPRVVDTPRAERDVALRLMRNLNAVHGIAEIDDETQALDQPKSLPAGDVGQQVMERRTNGNNLGPKIVGVARTALGLVAPGQEGRVQVVQMFAADPTASAGNIAIRSAVSQ